MPCPHYFDNVKRILRATITNQLAHFAPSLYVKITGQTGRGGGEDPTGEIVSYFQKCFDEYFAFLKVPPEEITKFLAGKQILEYGPGDVPGVALLMVAHGAERVICVDRFPLVTYSDKNIQVLRQLINSLTGEARDRAAACFQIYDEPSSKFKDNYIQYLICPNGLSGLISQIDLVISRAVLEHVNDLDATFDDMFHALRAGGVAVHLVDLKSHGLHRNNPLDFLNWPKWLWAIMYSYKGVPNRLRVNYYRQALAKRHISILRLEPTILANANDILEIRPHLAKPFCNISDEDLSWLGFWLVFTKQPIEMI